MTHILEPSPSTVHWGFFDAALPPVLTVASGASVTISSVSGARSELPPEGAGTILPAHRAILDNLEPHLGPHILTGPIAVDGAVPGDVLEVRIEAIDLIQDWGVNFTRPGLGTLPERFPERHVFHISIDPAERVACCPWGMELPLSPFFGIMAVAPAPEDGSVSTVEPRAFGGNIDNRELTAGSRLFLPVFAPGALFSVGDGHGCQGDGEVNLTALETALRGRFTLILHKGGSLPLPRAVTSTHYLTMGFHADLDRAAEIALDQMVTVLASCAGLSPAEAYALCSLACSLRVTQLVDGEKGIHAMIERSLLPDVAPEAFGLAN